MNLTNFGLIIPDHCPRRLAVEVIDCVKQLSSLRLNPLQGFLDSPRLISAIAVLKGSKFFDCQLNVQARRIG